MNNFPEATSLIIFGVTGDLTWRKLIPALYNNYKKGRLPESMNLVGFGRRELSEQDLRGMLRDGVQKNSPESYDDKVWEKFAGCLSYFKGDIGNEKDFNALKETLETIEKGPANRIYYLAISPEYTRQVVKFLGSSQQVQEKDPQNGWRRVVFEKPFGHDLVSAMDLDTAIHKILKENQIYRIDHYLGKETSQNILYFRFANAIFEPVWNRRYIDNVQISVTETVDVGHRLDYYESAGVVRDMFQNHLLQLLALVAMEPPSSFNADALRNEKTKVFESIRPISLLDCVHGQYEGYNRLDGAAPNTTTPTYAAMKLYVDNWRWMGVPFYLRSGKCLAKTASEIIIEFQRPPQLMFSMPDQHPFTPNILSMCIQPDEGIHLRFEAKVPDSDQETRSVEMDFHYHSSFKGMQLPEAYERLLLDVMQGDASLFTRSDSIEASWKLMDPIIQGWEKTSTPPLEIYKPGTWGPQGGEDLLSRDGRVWRMECRDEAGIHHVKIEFPR
jgi:glucose-6-phosphate 1-dehydrogenase